MNVVITPFATSLRHILSVILTLLLPRRYKRFIFLAGIYQQLSTKGIFNPEAYTKVNRAMCIARYDESLHLPESVYSKVVDRGRLLKAIEGIETTAMGQVCLTNMEAKRVGDSIASLPPEWLKYGDKKEMSKDVVSLFYCQPMHA